MKKILWLIIFLIFPFNVYAYSNYIIPGGETLGLEVNNRGVLVVGFYKVNGQYINQQLQIGDVITYIGKDEVNNTDSLTYLIEKNMDNDGFTATVLRDNEEIILKLELSYFNGTYRTGLYIKGAIEGIGTLTYVDPETNVYGILGHVINESKTNKKIEVKTGFSYDAKVSSFSRSTDGSPGSKNANINKNKVFGTIVNNTNYGVFGIIHDKLDKETLEVGNIKDVYTGLAYIYTTDKYNKINKYEINIIEVNKNTKEKNYYFEVTDEELIAMSGGIVQGMSGSPIIQNDKIIGAVTRVLVDDVSKGYGINIVTMLEEGDKILK